MSLVDPVLAWQYLLDCDADSRSISGDAAYYNIYETADHRFVTLAAVEAKFWSAFCAAVSRPEWVKRQADCMPQIGLIGELEDLFSDQPLRHWQAILNDVDCCFEPVPLMAKAGQVEQARARGLKNRFPGKINARSTPGLPNYKLFEPKDINWINE